VNVLPIMLANTLLSSTDSPKFKHDDKFNNATDTQPSKQLKPTVVVKGKLKFVVNLQLLKQLGLAIIRDGK
jgi:ABC-type xylose transport system substrate-binding protein